ncbi:MAG: hypothetical protein HY556_10020 [Euryarchaeota archaeon]|nr:hypothetical protein [Euryarchaeota archaeon]
MIGRSTAVFVVLLLLPGCLATPARQTTDALIASFEIERLDPGLADYPFDVKEDFLRIYNQYDILQQANASFAFVSPSGTYHAAPAGLPGPAVHADRPERGAWLLRIAVGEDGELVKARMSVVGRR